MNIRIIHCRVQRIILNIKIFRESLIHHTEKHWILRDFWNIRHAAETIIIRLLSISNIQKIVI